MFNGSGLGSEATHDPNSPSNVASGALRGAWGVEPIYGSSTFHALPSGYTVKKGDGGLGASTGVASSHVTREYQICLKCHSDFGYSDNNVYPVGTRPDLGSGTTGSTPPGTNALIQYTNQAKEFQAPFDHRGGTTAANTGAGPNYGTNNHRSWHPVMESTGRDAASRNIGTGGSSPWENPWRTNLGNQTMYCTDCHGSATANGTRVPTGSNPWGPHGSSKDFILKGDWDTNTGNGQGDDLCFKCHRFDTYPVDGGQRTGFWNPDSDQGRDDLHSYHRKQIGALKCTWCHVAVPHGWKNKAFLVNLNDVGPEVGGPSGGQEVCTGGDGWDTGNSLGGTCNGKDNGYTKGPYYLNAFNKIINFRPSGEWRENDCGSASGVTGRDWMRDTACESPN